MPNSIFVIDRNGTAEECEKIEGLSISFTENSENNKVAISKPYSFTSSEIVVNGSGNILKIDRSSQISRFKSMIVGNSNSVQIGSNSELRDVKLIMSSDADGRRLDIGKNFSFFGGSIHIVSNNNVMTIGDDCLFSSSINISTEDGHPVYNIYTKKMLNKGGRLVIGNNVCLGYNCTICKNGSITDHVIVGACSIVCKPISESNCIAVGEPAKVIKRGVDFSKLTIESYLKSCRES